MYVSVSSSGVPFTFGAPIAPNQAFHFEPSASSEEGSIASLLLDEDKEEDEEVHPRISEYKPKGKSDQERRREELLEKQKSKRRNVTEQMRKMALLEQNESDTNEMGAEITQSAPSEGMQVVKQSKAQERRQVAEERKKKFYSKQLMLPEMMQEIPRDLVGGWYVVPFPANSKRCLVLTSAGQTTSRLDDGTILHQFPSALPNGSRGQLHKNSSCLLDCIFHEESSTYFVLDLMNWKGNLYYECATDFRFFWRDGKLAETSIGQVTPQNAFRFASLPYFECDRAGIQAAFEGPFPVPREGLLFFNKQTHYFPGITPLVCALPLNQVVSTLAPLFSS